MVKRDAYGKAIVITFEDAKELLDDMAVRADALAIELAAWEPTRVPTFWGWVRSGFKSF